MTIIYRKFEPDDRMPVYRLFRESVWDFMLQNGIVAAGDENDTDEYFRQQKDLYLHLEQTAAEDWVAEGEDGSLLGWARSIERDRHLQLTHFFVAPDAQGGGIGRELLERAFPLGRGRQRSIIATTSTLALSLYLRQEVCFQGMAFSVYGDPKRREYESRLQVEEANASPKTLENIVQIDSRVLGYRRPQDLEFFMSRQPVYLFRDAGRLVGYAFGCDGYSAGPAATLEARHLPVLLHRIEHSACDAGMDSLWLTIPAAARHAVNWALSCGYRIDPFYEVLLARESSMQFDRYVMSRSAFVW